MTTITIRAALVGFVSIGLQFVFNRILFFYLVSTDYAIATIVGLHLAGFATGAMIATRRSSANHWLLFLLLPFGIAVVAITHLHGLGVLGAKPLLLILLFLALILAGVAGAQLGVLLRLHPNFSGPLVVADTLGSVLGAWITGFGLLPHAGVTITLIVLFAGATVLLLLAAPRFSAVPAGGAMLALILLANWQFEHSASSHSHLRVGEFTFATQWNSDVAVVDSIPSRFGMLSVIDLNGPPHQELVPIRVLHIDDMPLCAALRDASDVETQSEWEVGSWTAREVSSRQSRPKVAIIGLGCGFTLAATLRGLPKDAEVTIIEINEQMPRMTEHFAEITKRPLADPRVTLTIADGFRYFLDRAKSAPPFDAVIVDITWMRDAALTHMFSQQFYQAVMNHITPDGVMAVWSESLAANEAQTAITFRTIQATWPEVVLRRIFGADIFLATRHRSLTASLNEHDWELLRSTRQLAAQVPLNTLDRLALSPVAFGSLKSDYSFSKFGSD